MKKRCIALILGGLLAVSAISCAGKDAAYEEGGGSTGQEGQGISGEEEQKALEEGVSVTHTTMRGSIGFRLPNDWRYQIRERENGQFDISIHPMAEAEGELVIRYTEGFAVCGTGLEERGCTVNGMDGREGTYDNMPYWGFIAFRGDYEGYVIENRAGEYWWDQQEHMIAAILDTLTLGDAVQDPTEVLSLIPDQPLAVDASGKELCLTILTEGTERGSVRLTCGDREVEVTEYAEWLMDSYVVKIDDGRMYVLVGGGYSNDFGEVFLLKLAGDQIVSLESVQGIMEDSVTANYIEIQRRIDVLGSYNGWKHYSITEDGFYSDEEIFDFRNVERDGIGRQSLVLIQDIPIDIWGEQDMLESGTVIYPVGCDMENHRFYFEFDKEGFLETGSLEYSAHSERFGFSVEGMDEYEVFETVPYVG